MSKRNNRGSTLALSFATPVDYGPAVRVDARGRVVSWKGAASVVIEDRVDPTTPTPRMVRGARRRNVLQDLRDRDVINKNQIDAAHQFLDDCSLAAGGSARFGPLLGGGAPGPRAGFPELQSAAVRRVSLAREAARITAGSVFWHVVFQNASLAEYEALHHLRHGTATEMLRDVLDALDQHYHGA